MKPWLLFPVLVALVVGLASWTGTATAAEPVVGSGQLNVVLHAPCGATANPYSPVYGPYSGVPYGYSGSPYLFGQASQCGVMQFIGSGAIGSFSLAASSYRDDSRSFSLVTGDYSIAEVGAYPVGLWGLPTVTCTGNRRGRFFNGQLGYGFQQSVRVVEGESVTCIFDNEQLAVATAVPAQVPTATSTPVPAATPVSPTATAIPQPQPIIVNVTVPPQPTAVPVFQAPVVQPTPVVLSGTITGLPRFSSPNTGDGGLVPASGLLRPSEWGDENPGGGSDVIVDDSGGGGGGGGDLDFCACD